MNLVKIIENVQPSRQFCRTMGYTVTSNLKLAQSFQIQAKTSIEHKHNQILINTMFFLMYSKMLLLKCLAFFELHICYKINEIVYGAQSVA